jgi:hypothetical protein
MRATACKCGSFAVFSVCASAEDAAGELAQFTIGAGANCSDGSCGDVIRVVTDPIARTVTHLVVEPKHHYGSGRLVPLSFVEAEPDGVRLACTMAEFAQLDPAEEQQFIAATAAMRDTRQARCSHAPRIVKRGGLLLALAPLADPICFGAPLQLQLGLNLTRSGGSPISRPRRGGRPAGHQLRRRHGSGPGGQLQPA